MPLGDRALVGVPRDHELRARIDERAEHAVAPGDRPLARPPRRSSELVVQRDDAQRAGRCGGELRHRPLELAVADGAGLVAPRPHGVDADEADAVGDVHRAGRLPEPLELRPRPREPGREGVRDVVIARNGNDGNAQVTEKRGRPFVLVAASAVGEIAAGDDQLGL